MFDTRTRFFFFACSKDAAGAALKNAAPAPGSRAALKVADPAAPAPGSATLQVNLIHETPGYGKI